MSDAGLSFNREKKMPIYYKNQRIGTRRVDFLVKGIVSVELKARTLLEDVHLINYLKIYDLEISLLINFGERSLKFKRLINKKIREILKPKVRQWVKNKKKLRLAVLV